MDAVGSSEKTLEVELYVPWDAPEAVVDVSSAGVVPLRDLPDVIGLVGHRDNATEGCILQGRDPVVSGCLFRTAGGLTRISMM